jgi:hypothetical protein
MGRSSYHGEWVLVCYNDVSCGREWRIVFRGNSLRQKYPEAAGFINYKGVIAKLYRDTEGRLCVESTEDLIRDYPPLTLRWDAYL